MEAKLNKRNLGRIADNVGITDRKIETFNNFRKVSNIEEANRIVSTVDFKNGIKIVSETKLFKTFKEYEIYIQDGYNFYRINIDIDNNIRTYSRMGIVGAYEKIKDLSVIVEDRNDSKYVILRTVKSGYYFRISDNEVTELRILH